MSYKISKELFEAVMNVETINGITLVPKLKEYDYVDGISYTLKSGGGFISYDTFFFKCKKWAKTQGYVIWSYLDQANTFNFDGIKINSFISKEQQAVFDACQWILDNKDKQ